jgi:hypothetical protein
MIVFWLSRVVLLLMASKWMMSMSMEVELQQQALERRPLG